MLSPATPRGTWDVKIALFERAWKAAARWAQVVFEEVSTPGCLWWVIFLFVHRGSCLASDSRFQPMSKECAELYAQVSPQYLFLEVQAVFLHQNFWKSRHLLSSPLWTLKPYMHVYIKFCIKIIYWFPIILNFFSSDTLGNGMEERCNKREWKHNKKAKACFYIKKTHFFT